MLSECWAVVIVIKRRKNWGYAIHKQACCDEHSVAPLRYFKTPRISPQSARKGLRFLLGKHIAVKQQCWRSHSQMIPARPHLLFSQPNYSYHPTQKRPYLWQTTGSANENGVCCRLGRKPTNRRVIASEGHAVYAFSGKNVSSCSSLAVSCNRTVLWDGESHVCRRKGKFSTPKLLLWELGHWIWWLFSGIFGEK